MDNFFSFKTDKKLVIKVEKPEAQMSIIKRLGKPKFWVSNNDFNQVMERMYKIASRRAKEIYSSSAKD